MRKARKLEYMEFFKDKIISIIDVLAAPLTYLSSVWLWIVRRMNIKRMAVSRKIFRSVGVLPIRDHYYEPLFDTKHLRYSLRKDRTLPGIDFNIKEQLDILGRFKFNDELERIPKEKTDKLEFYYHNGRFGCCDAQYLYNMIRLFKPARMIEIGSGHSTLMAVSAVKANRCQYPDYHCEHVCIEPYEYSWLENLDVKVIRKRVEELDEEIFSKLNKGDILFIDSSHVIRPQGDLLFEYLEILPCLKSGVLVHIHDIFTPKDYLDEWVSENIRLWNEQYLLEAFLTFNNEYKIIGALNYLVHHHFPEISKACPILLDEPHKEPCSFWIARR